MLPSYFLFCQFQCSESHTLPTGVVETYIVCIPQILHPCSIKFGTGQVHKKLMPDCEVHENQHCESHSLLTGINEFLLLLHIQCQICQIQDKRSLCVAVKHLWVSWKHMQGHTVFTQMHSPTNLCGTWKQLTP